MLFQKTLAMYKLQLNSPFTAQSCLTLENECGDNHIYKHSVQFVWNGAEQLVKYVIKKRVSVVL